MTPAERKHTGIQLAVNLISLNKISEVVPYLLIVEDAQVTCKQALYKDLTGKEGKNCHAILKSCVTSYMTSCVTRRKGQLRAEQVVRRG